MLKSIHQAETLTRGEFQAAVAKEKARLVALCEQPFVLREPRPKKKVRRG